MGQFWDDLWDVINIGGDDDDNPDPEDIVDDINAVNPYTANFETGQILDSEGNVVKDYGDLLDQIREAGQTSFPSLNEWMEGQGYQFNDVMGTDETGAYTNPVMQNLQGLIEEMQNGPSAGDVAAAENYAADIMGLSAEEYQNIVNELATVLPGGPEAAEGMSEEEIALRERANRTNLREMEIRAQRQIQNIQANTGSVARSLAAADEAMRSINDAQIQQDIALADEIRLRKEAQFEGQQQQWQMMVEQGRISQSEYLSLVQNSQAVAFEGYAMQINTMLQENQQYIQMYQADLQGIQANIQNIYNAVQAEMGIDAGMMDFIQQQYEMELNPLLTQLDVALTMLEYEESQGWDWGAFGTALIGGALIATGLGAIPGIALGTAAASGAVTGGVGLIGA